MDPAVTRRAGSSDSVRLSIESLTRSQELDGLLASEVATFFSPKRKLSVKENKYIGLAFTAGKPSVPKQQHEFEEKED